MAHDAKKAIKRLTAHLFIFPIEDYLSSENFSVFCMKYNLDDAWKEYLVYSGDRPDLYGRETINNALVLFLHHIFHSRPGEFLELFTRFLIGYSQWNTQSLSFDDLKKDLHYLGYSDKDIENTFSSRSLPESCSCHVR
jgi:hypothetical protein